MNRIVLVEKAVRGSSISPLILGGAAVHRCDKRRGFRFGFSRGGDAVPRKSEEAREELAFDGKARPQRLKPHSQQCSNRSGEPLRHAKSSARASEELTVGNLSDIRRPARGGSKPATALDCRPITVLNPDFAFHVRDACDETTMSVVRHR